jgi:anti-sigma B factor antagonist
MSFTISKKAGDIIIIKCPPRLDISVSDDLKNIMTDLIAKKKYKIIIDLTHTKYIDSSGLGAIVSRIAVTRSNGGDVRLATTSRLILNLLELTHLNKILSCYDNILTAVNSF